MKLLVLSGADVERLLTMSACIDLMARALESLARGEVILPLRQVLRLPDSPNVYALMPAYSRSLRAIGTKLITVFPGNHGTALDSHQGCVVLFDGENGSLLAIMDAASITAIRTAAVSGVATRLLATENSETVGVLGSGVQGRTHIRAMIAVRPVRRVLVWSRTRAHAESLAAWAATTFGVESRAVPEARAAVEPSDIVCTVTASREPVLEGKWLRDGTHINAVGASLATTRELDSEAVRRSRVYVDRTESAMNEAGDLLIPMQEGSIRQNHIAGELGNILTGETTGRTGPREITLFKSLGIAVEDLASAHYLFDKAMKEGAGTRVEFGSGAA